MLEVRWYYRPTEIPPNLYHLLIEDRYHENRKCSPPLSVTRRDVQWYIESVPVLLFPLSRLSTRGDTAMLASVNVYINHCIHV